MIQVYPIEAKQCHNNTVSPFIRIFPNGFWKYFIETHMNLSDFGVYPPPQKKKTTLFQYIKLIKKKILVWKDKTQCYKEKKTN